VKLFDNGIVIQDKGKNTILFSGQFNFSDTEYKNFTSYRGTYRYKSWPLEFCDDQVSKQLTAETKKWFTIHYPDNTILYNLMIPEREFCIEYIKHCHQIGINIRTLFCQSEVEITVWDSTIPNLKFLGYDYASLQLVSTIPGELLDPDGGYLEHPLYKALVQCKDMLNDNKLFENEKDINIFVDRRGKVVESNIRDHVIEVLGDLVVFRISEVIGEL